jgi:putative DNA primase/helicase
MSLLGRVPVHILESVRAVLWNGEFRNGKFTKVPYQVQRPSTRSSVNDPRTWGKFVDAVAAYEDGKADGVGIVLGDGLIGVDLDQCRNAETGVIEPWARKIIIELDSYTEISPSDTGVHVYLLSAAVMGGRRKGSIEIYPGSRFFTVTGKHVLGTPTTIERRDVELATLCAEIFGQPVSKSHGSGRGPRPTPADDDQERLERAFASRNGAKIRALWAGDWSAYSSQSEADQALANHLAFWFDCDPARMDAAFRRSGLMRAKWDERRGDRTYGAMTIEKVLAGCHRTYRSGEAAKSGEVGNPPVQGKIKGPIPLGRPDPQTGRLVLSPRRTLPTAIAYVESFYHHADGRLLHDYAGVLLTWQDNRYVEIEPAALTSHLLVWLHGALRYVVDRRGQLTLTDFDSNPGTVRQALDSIRASTYLPATTTSPCWLDDLPHPTALEVLPCRSSSIHLPTGTVLPATPALFTTTALDFDYDAQAPVPTQWLTFLDELWGTDAESIGLLQEWFGYSLILDTSQHKMLLLVGPRRSGKGTIGRILTRLVGAANVAGPTTASLAERFGLQPLLGKSLAIVSDARFAGDSINIIVERLLCISGEDSLTIDRKFLGAATLKLPTRFVFLTNELPRLTDASLALAGRFLLLKLTRSFFGMEDPTLTARLSTELPGILCWAIAGWTRLHARGRFVQCEAVQDEIQHLEDLASPIHPFIRDCCTVQASLRVPVDTLYCAWEMWAQENGHKPSNKQTFGRNLASAVPQVVRRRGTDDEPFYDGLAITAATTAALDRWRRARARPQETGRD